jgi:hypothetical protein
MRLSVFAGIQGVVVAALLSLAFPATPLAQTAEQPTPKPAPTLDVAQNCPGPVAADRPRVIPAAFDLAALNADQVRLTFIGHATFLIESPQLVRIATDYNDYVRPPILPDIVTMNHAHDTHYTDHPDPAIKYVLRGWGPSETEPAIWDVIATCGCATCRPISAVLAAAPSATAILSSFSRSPICASPISAICTTR